MKQLLLNINIVVDLFVGRAGSANTRLAIALAEASGATLWVYAGSVQTLEYVVASELRTHSLDIGEPLTGLAARGRARHLLERITAPYQWLAALAAEGPVFSDADREDAQLYGALDRFAEGPASLLTRARATLARDPVPRADARNTYRGAQTEKPSASNRFR